MKVSLGRYPKGRDVERKLSVKIDPWDTWSTDHTLALIIVPLLQQLKETKHGTPYSDEADAPDEFKGEDPDKGKYDPDGYNTLRWEWILDEMIWAFTQLTDDSEEDSYYHNRTQLELVSTPMKGKKMSSISFNYRKDPEKPPYFRDDEGLKAFEARKTNGFRLFGKYLQSLWD